MEKNKTKQKQTCAPEILDFFFVFQKEVERFPSLILAPRPTLFQLSQVLLSGNTVYLGGALLVVALCSTASSFNLHITEYSLV